MVRLAVTLGKVLFAIISNFFQLMFFFGLRGMDVIGLSFIEI